MGPTWGPPGSCRPQMGPLLDPWTLLSRMLKVWLCFIFISCSGCLYYQHPSRLLYWHLHIHQWLGSRNILYLPSICLLYNVAFLKRVLFYLEQLTFHSIVTIYKENYIRKWHCKHFQAISKYSYLRFWHLAEYHEKVYFYTDTSTRCQDRLTEHSRSLDCLISLRLNHALYSKMVVAIGKKSYKNNKMNVIFSTCCNTHMNDNCFQGLDFL